MKRKNIFSFIELFGLPELKHLFGKRYVNLLLLTFIFFVSLLAVGIGNGTISYLKEKMDNPYIRFLTVEKDMSIKDVDLNTFKEESIKNRFGYTEVIAQYTGYANFLSRDQTEKNNQSSYKSAYYRLITTDEEFYEFLEENSSELIMNDNVFQDEKFGIIATVNFLNKLGLDSNSPFVYYYKSINGKDCSVPLPISAVVKQLPDQLDVLVSSKLFDAFRNLDVLDVNSEEHATYSQFYTQDLPENFDFESKGFEVFEANTHVGGVYLVKNGVFSDQAFNDFPKLIRTFDYDRPSGRFSNKKKTRYIDKFNFSFARLDSTRSFKAYLNSINPKLDIDISIIEAKENFRFFERLVSILSWSLILFGIMSIIVFISNLITFHINQNKKTLGTLKAFGMSNNNLILLYSGISGTMIIFSFSIGWFLSQVMGQSIAVLVFLIGNVDAGADQIMFEPSSLFYMIGAMVMLPMLFIFLKLVSVLKTATPGDLIYERG